MVSRYPKWLLRLGISVWNIENGLLLLKHVGIISVHGKGRLIPCVFRKYRNRSYRNGIFLKILCIV